MPSSVGLVAGSVHTISEPCCRPLTDFAVQFGVVVFVCSKTDHGPDQQCKGTFWNTFAGFLLFQTTNLHWPRPLCAILIHSGIQFGLVLHQILTCICNLTPTNGANTHGKSPKDWIFHHKGDP